MIHTQINMMDTIMCYAYYAYTLKTIGLYFAYKTVQYIMLHVQHHIFTRMRKYVNIKSV